MNPGDTIGHYRIIEPIGHGGMGEVYLAEDTKLHRRVALKTLPAAFASDPERRRRFEREAQAIAALNHPGIVTIYSVEVEGPTPFITMEYVEGRPLRQTIPAGGSTVDVLLKTGIGIADAVAAAHQRGIVHRDLKPANVMIGPDGRVKVLDFGLAKIRETEPAFAADASTQMVEDDLTGGGRIVGTVAYMSPEQAEGKPVDQRSDIFSLGVVLHEMATGERPFKGDTEISVISAIIKDTPSAVTDSRPDLPLPFARIVKRCLVKDPQRRYQSARDLQTDLEDLKQDVDSGVLSTPSGLSRTPAVQRRSLSRGALYGGLAAVLIAAAAGAWWTFGGKQPTQLVPDRFTRLTNSGTASIAAISPDGHYVVHIKRENQLPGLWVRQTGTTSDVRILPPSDFRVDGIAFSPDGSFVYYNTYPATSGVATLFKVPVLGGVPVRVLEDVDSAVSFSPDSERFSFLRGRPNENATVLMIANTDGSGVRELAVAHPPIGLDTDRAAWSPDGRVLIVTGSRRAANGTGRPRLFAVDAASGTISDFGPDWIYINGVAWMPDGRSVIVCGIDTDASQSPQLWQVAWPAGDRRRITTGVNGYDTVSLSADGHTIATVEGEGHSNIWVYPMTGGPGRQVTFVARGNPGGGGLTFTPSGRIIYGAQPGDAANQLFIMDADGSNVSQLTNIHDFAALPVVSLDEKWVYFNGGAGEQSTIFRMPLAGGDPQQLTHGQSDYHAVVSPDGQWVYYASNGTNGPEVMKIPAAGGEPKVVARAELRFNLATVSSDGAWLYGSAWNQAGRRQQPAKVSTIDGTLEFIENPPPRGGLMRDGKTWLMADARNNVPGIYMRQPDGGPDRLIVNLGDEQSWRTALSFDGRTLAVVRGRSTSDVVLIRAK